MRHTGHWFGKRLLASPTFFGLKYPLPLVNVDCPWSDTTLVQAEITSPLYLLPKISLQTATHSDVSSTSLPTHAFHHLMHWNLDYCSSTTYLGPALGTSHDSRTPCPLKSIWHLGFFLLHCPLRSMNYKCTPQSDKQGFLFICLEYTSFKVLMFILI